jgi:Flp pilus assembly protein TadG
MIEKYKRFGLMMPSIKSRFAKDAKGSVAVEFALTAIPFFALLFAIMEAGIIFFAAATLDQSVNDQARLIRTGQSQSSGTTASQFKTAICASTVFLTNCTSNLSLDIRVYDKFANVSDPDLVKSDGSVDTSKLKFNLGNAGDIVMIRVLFNWSIMSPLPTGLANNSGASGSVRLLQSTAVFRNEPYTS